MSTNITNSFPEAKLGSDFAKDKSKIFKEYIDRGISFVVISMPGVGVSHFLKYLAIKDFALFFYVDTYSLPHLTKYEFYKNLLIQLGGKAGSKNEDGLLSESKKLLETLSKKHEKIVIIFSRFDQIKKEFDSKFLSDIRSLTKVKRGKIILIFTSTKPLNEISPQALVGGNLGFYSENLFFLPYSKSDLNKLLTLRLFKPLPSSTLYKLIDLSGGHNQLLHILLNSQKQNFLQDQFVKLQMKDIISYLDYSTRKSLQRLAFGKKVSEISEYLLGVGIVKQINQDVEFFTPLLKEYVKSNFPVKLPVKEGRLFKLLRKNLGRVVSKDEIFAEVWEGNPQASDWALDALIYRLRRHPFIQNQGYIIESYKKQGYTLVQT